MKKTKESSDIYKEMRKRLGLSVEKNFETDIKFKFDDDNFYEDVEKLIKISNDDDIKITKQKVKGE